MNYFPLYFSSRAIIFYILILFVCSLIFINQVLPFIWVIFGLFEVLFFFFFTYRLTSKWGNIPENLFIKKIFRTALFIRICYVIFSYFFYIAMTGQPFEFSAADSLNYHESAIIIKDLIANNSLNTYFISMGGRVSDMGYGLYLSIVYTLFSDSIFIARLIKAFLSAYTCILIYKLTRRNFGDGVGRIAAIIAMLLPNFIYYCGLHLKETEMLFISVFFLERSDFLIRSRRLYFITLLMVILSGLLLFAFRTVLGATAFLSLLVTSVFSSKKVIAASKRFTIVLFIGFIAFAFTGGAIYNEVEEYWGNRDRNLDQSMDFRETRTGGNSFAKYGKTAVFAPIILMVPFPTMVYIETQENQMLMNGSSYIRNVYAFFVLFGLLALIKFREIGKHTLILSFVICYLTVLSMSGFAMSERFHLPAVPVLIILAAYGISVLSPKNSIWYLRYLFLIAIVILGWNWFKLAGRGLI